jgi:hypothetical protein
MAKASARLAGDTNPVTPWNHWPLFLEAVSQLVLVFWLAILVAAASSGSRIAGVGNHRAVAAARLRGGFDPREIFFECDEGIYLGMSLYIRWATVFASPSHILLRGAAERSQNRHAQAITKLDSPP